MDNDNDKAGPLDADPDANTNGPPSFWQCCRLICEQDGGDPDKIGTFACSLGGGDA